MIVTPVDPADEDGLADVGLILKLVHVGVATPDCVTPNVFPAMEALEERDDVDVFCCHDTVTELEPDPLVGDTDSHDPLPDALQLPP